MASANNPNIQMYIPASRWIFGSLTEKVTTDKDGRPITDPAKHYYMIAVAVPKLINGVQNPELGAAVGAPFQAAMNFYGNHPGIGPLVQQGLAGSFKFKIDDGDTTMNKDRTGLRWGEYGKGCYVFKLRSNFPIKTANAQNVEIAASEIKCGYFVDIAGSSSANELLDNNAGVYLNANVVRMIGYGAEITSSIDPAKAFGSVYTGPSLPGMSTMPLAPASAGLPGASAATGLPQPQQMVQQPVQQVAMLPGLPVAPVVQQPVVLPVQQPVSVPQTTGYPTNVQPHTQFVSGGMPGM